ncbi:MAG: MerC domain-containing protein [Pseudomonadota bacterium]
MSSPTTPAPQTRRLDLYAASLSALCLIHCALLPLLAVAIPAAIIVADLEWLHGTFALLAAPATLWVVRQALREGEQQLFVTVALIGLGALLVGAFVEGVGEHEEWITVVGACLLGGAHFRRWLQLREQRVALSAP